LRAQPAPLLTYVYILGASDTIGVETLQRTPTSVIGELRMRGQPRVVWTQAHSNRTPGVLSLQVFAPNSDATEAPLQNATVTIVGDSAIAEIATRTQKQTQRLASRSGAVALVNSSVLHAALLASYARLGNRTSLDIFLSSGGTTVPATVGVIGDSVTFTVAGSTSVIVSEADGMPSRIVVRGQNLRVVRATQPVSATAGMIDYSAPAGAPYSAEAVRIPTAAGFALAGTFTKPVSASGKVPVVITISGSGPQERDGRLAPVPGYANFREIADTLGRRGVAVLRYDDRGVGASEGAESRANATSADFADDVRAVVRYLRTRSDVDASRIVLIGHSEGGMIAPMIAATDSLVRAIGLLAGPAYNGRRILEFQNEQGIRSLDKLSATQKDSVRRTVPRALDSLAAANPWMGFFMRHDPLAVARRVKQPVLVLQGDTDLQVTKEQADSLAATLRAAGNGDVTLRHFPNVNHLLLRDPSGAPGGYAALPDKRMPREVRGAIADWVVRVTR
jgi:hypothetical protein